MAKVIGQSEDNNLLIEMARADAAKVSGVRNLKIGDEFNLLPIYNRLTWLEKNENKVKHLAAELKSYSENLESVANSVTAQLQPKANVGGIKL